MITATLSRDRGTEHFDMSDHTFKNSHEALIHLAKHELGWGGRIVGLGPTHIKVVTTIFECRDTSVYKGTAEELKPLFELVYFYLEAKKKYGNTIVDGMVNSTERLPEEIRGVPLYLSMMTPLLAGNHLLKVVVMLACGVKDEEDVKAGLGVRIEDLVAASQLSKEGLCSFREALTV